MISYAQNMVDFFTHSSQFYYTITDLDGKFTYVNPLFSNKFSFLAPCFMGTSVTNTIYTEDIPKYQQALCKCINFPGTTVTVEVRHPSSNGHLYHSRLELLALPDELGTPACIQTIGTDITSNQANCESQERELNKLSAELKQANRELSEILQNVSEAIFKLDLQGRVVYVSPEFSRVTDYSFGEIYRKHWLDFIHKNDQPIFLNAVNLIVQHRHVMRNICYRFRLKNDTFHWSSTSAALVLDDEGEPMYILCVSRDITEIKYSEDALRASEERYKMFIEQSSEAIWRYELEEPVFTGLDEKIIIEKLRSNGFLAECNDIMASMYGRRISAELIGGHLDTLFDFNQARNLDLLKAFVQSGYRLSEAESLSYDKNGQPRYLITNLVGIVENGYLKRVWGTQQDITEKKLAVERARHLAGLVENTTDVLTSADLEFKVISWNKAAEYVYGIKAEEVLGRNVRDFIDIHYQDATRDEVRSVLAATGEWRGEMYFVRPGDQKPITLLMNFHLQRDENGEPIGYIIGGTDITDQKQKEEQLKKAEAQLQQSEVFYRSLIGNSLDGILLINTDGLITFCSSSLKHILGYEADEVIGKNIFRYVHPDDVRLALNRSRGKVTDAGNPDYIVIRLLRNDNEWVWCMVRGHNLFDNPHVRSFVIYLHDDSLRKKAEDELIESERRLRTAQQIAGLGYLELNRLGQLYCSDEISQVLAIEENKLPTNLESFVALIHPADRKKIRVDIQAALNTGKGFEHEFRIQGDEMNETIIQSIGSLVTEPATGESILKITIQDVTKIRSAQLALRTSESRFRSLFEHSIDGILLTQPGGLVKSANPAICEMLGYTKEEILKQKRRDIFDFNDPHFSRIVEAKEENGRFKCELSLVHKSGKKIPCEVSSVLFRDSEGRAYHSTIVRDITRQKEAEQQLKKREGVLSAIAEATNRLILEKDLDSSINYSIELIGKVVGADRAYIFESHTNELGQQFTSQRYEWCAENIIPQAGKSSAVNVPFSDFMNVIQVLRENKPFSAFVNQYHNEKLKKRWQAQHIVSILILPIFMQGELWGFVGFDECHYERHWENWEIDILKAFGSSLAGAIERKKAEHELSQTNARLGIALNDLNKIMDYSQDVICSFDENGDFLQVGAASERLWGYSPQEVIGRSFREFLLPADVASTEALIARMRAGKSVATNFENHFVRKDGSLVTLDWSAYWYEKERIAFCVARDITLQKEIEQQLIASESRFRSFMDNSPAAAWICDAEGRYVYINKFVAAHLSSEGYNSVGKSIQELYPPEFAKLYHENNMQVLRLNCPLEFLEKGVRPDGSAAVLLVYKFPVLIGPDQYGVGGVAVDITDKTKAEEALRTSEQNLKAIFSSTRDAFILLDRNMKLVSYNPIAAELYSMFTEGGDISDHPNLLGVVPESRQTILRTHIANAFKGQPIEYEVCYQLGGTSLWFYIVMQPVIGSNGQVDAVCATISNITSKKMAEQRITETAEQLTNIMETISDGMFILDKDLMIQYMNNAAEKLLRMQRSDLIGPDKQDNRRKLADAISLDAFTYNLYYKKALQEKKAVHFEKYISALQTWFEIDAYPVGDGITIYFRDITARKRQEMTLSLEKKVLEMNAVPESTLPNTVNTFLKGIERIYPGMICSVLSLQEDQSIKPVAAPSLPAEFTKAVDGIKIGPVAGSCGTAMFLRKPVYVSDIENDPLWVHYKGLALQFNLRACWSIPIINAYNEVLASFAVYYNVPKEPTDHEIKAIERASDILRVIVENKRAEDHIRVTNMRYHFVTKATNEAIWDLDLRTNKIYWAEGYYTLFGYDYANGNGSLEQSHQRTHPEDLKRIKASLQNFLRKKTKSRWEDEYRYRKADGTYAYVVDKAYLIIDKDGNPTRMIGSMQDITSRKELEQRLIEQEVGKQRMLTQATIDGQEKERKEIGKELHDNINQILSTTKLYLDLAYNGAKGSTAEMISVSSKNIMEAINEIRKLSRSLVPPTLGDLGLTESIKDLCEAFNNMKTFNIEFTHKNVREKLLADNQKLMLFRIIQEQTNNIVKHAKASNVKIELKASRGQLQLEISDDGKGFDIANTKKGVGLNNIINRAELFNGKVEIIAAPGNGCKVKVTIPVKY